MGLKSLNNAGVSKLLEDASNILRQRGLAKGVRINPENGNVDLISSLALAAGAQEKDLISSVSTSDFSLIPANEVRFHASYEILDAVLMEDPEEWADKPEITVTDVAKLMSKTAWKLKIAIC
jgi:hypothetical protein